MKRLLLADVHANLPALEAVLQEAGTVDEIWVAGDLIGYGPNPDECIRLLREVQAVCILGNHDIELKEHPDNGYWNHWTWDALSPSNRDFLFSLPEWKIMEDGSVLMHHFPPFCPDGTWKTPRIQKEGLPGVSGRRVIFGHEHYYTACVYEGKQYLSLPAVGQQRDASPDARYMLEEDGVLTLHQVPYDVERLVHDLRTVGLDEPFLGRWIHFVQTGYDDEWSFRVQEVLRRPPFPQLPLFADSGIVPPMTTDAHTR